MKILNLTQHVATPDQVEQGVIEPCVQDKNIIRHLLTFEYLPKLGDIENKAEALAIIAASSGCEAAMIGGAPYLMKELEEALKRHNIRPLYAFSKRVTEERQTNDGSVTKIQIFKHEGFIEK